MIEPRWHSNGSPVFGQRHCRCSMEQYNKVSYPLPYRMAGFVLPLLIFREHQMGPADTLVRRLRPDSLQIEHDSRAILTESPA